MESLFLVRSKVTVRHYMSDDEIVNEEIDLVVAESHEDAHQKTVAHYQGLTEDYSVSYMCDVIETKQAIR